MSAVQCTSAARVQAVAQWLKAVDRGGLDRVLKGVLDSQTFVNAERWRASARPKWFNSMGLILLAFAGNSIQLVPDGTLILHGLIILLMVLILNRTLFKPINRILEERERTTSGLLSEAEQTVTRVDESVRQYQKTLREARAEGYQLLERQRAEAVSERDRQIAAARDALSKQTAAQKTEIKTQAEAARSMLSDEARRLATRISAQILGRPSAGGGDSAS